MLDIGAGAGKFCVAASLLTDCVYFGIAHRPRLVAVAQDDAARISRQERGDRRFHRQRETG
jgi:hypothetical protein